jgi:multicomponent Na+:H+ antiporter subunit D
VEHLDFLAAALLTPLTAAAGIIAAARYPNLREAASIVAAAGLCVLLGLLVPVLASGAHPRLSLMEILPNVDIAFAIEPLGLGFALLAAFLWLVTVVYSIGYMRGHGEQHQTRFYAFFALSIGAAVGAAFAANLLTLYLFYELLTLATYHLVTHGGGARDRAGGRTYVTVLLGTSLTFLLVAIAWTYALTGGLAFVDGGLLATAELPPSATPAALAVLYALFLLGTGKAALMPFHRWLPAAMVAPTPVSALLHAVAVVKLGVFAILKVTVYTFGTGLLQEHGAAKIMQYVAAATLLSAALLALREDNLKRRLAFSTISQLAYIVLAATIATQSALLGGGLHIAAHAFAKITLFFCAGMILVALHKTSVSELTGAGRLMPFTFTAWIVASLCVIGLPLTGGFWSKWYLAGGAFDAGEPWLVAVILLGSLLAMGYLLPPAIRAFYVQMPAAAEPARAPWPSLAAIGCTAAGTVMLFFAAPALLEFLEEFAQ